MASRLNRDLRACILSHLCIKDRLCVASILNKAWNDAINHPLVWDKVNLWRVHATDYFMEQFAAFFTKRNICPGAVTDLDVQEVTSDGLEHLFSLSGISQLDVHGVDGDHIAFVQRELPRFGKLSQLRLKGGWDGIDFTLPLLPHLTDLSIEGESGGVAGLRQQPNLTHLMFSQCSGSFEADDFPPSLRHLAMLFDNEDPVEGQQHIVELPNLTHLHTSQPTSLFLFLSHNNELSLRFQCANLTSLTISDDESAAEYSHIECIAQQLHHLQELEISSSNITGAAIGAISTMASLRRLTLEGPTNHVGDSDLQPLRTLTNLQYVALRRFPHITEQCLVHIASLPQLSEIDLLECPCITSVFPLCACVGLRALRLRDETRYSDTDSRPLPSSLARSLSSLSALHTLQLSFSPTDQDMSMILGKLCSLRSLEINARKALFSSSSLALLPNLSSLERLTLPLPLHTPSDLSVCIISIISCGVHGLRSLSLMCPEEMGRQAPVSYQESWIEEKKMVTRLGAAMPRLEPIEVTRI